MSRDPLLYLEDIERACDKIERFVADLDQHAFVTDERTYDAVLRYLEILGEAAKRVPESIRVQMPAVPWRAIAGFRDFLAHAYFAPVRGSSRRLCRSARPWPFQGRRLARR